MGCRELDITSYFRIIQPEEIPLSCEFSCTQKTANSRFNPVISVSISNYRYYSGDLGRWISRDSIGEKGGENLYNFVNNHIPNSWDYLGRVERGAPIRYDAGRGRFGERMRRITLSLRPPAIKPTQIEDIDTDEYVHTDNPYDPGFERPDLTDPNWKPGMNF